MTENILDHDDAGIDHQPEIERADRQQVRTLALQHQDQDREGQRKGNGRGNNDRAAQIAEKRPLQEEDQRDPRHQIFQHGVDRQVDQVGSVIDAIKMHARRQDARGVDVGDFLLHRFDRWHRLRAALHQHDALNDVVLIVIAGDTQPRRIADLDMGDVLQQDRLTIGGADQHILDPRHRLDQPDTADDRRLRAEVDRLPADIAIALA
ncbi:hypothetical protein D9M73_118260 [compost metagenome]